MSNQAQNQKSKTLQLINLKKPDLRYPILKVLSDRFSPREYLKEDVKEEDIKTMFEAARWAPSARNLQPWYFYWTRQGTQSFEKIRSCIPHKHHWSSSANVFIVACYMDDGNEYALYDLATAVFSFIIQAQSMGYYARQIGNFDRIKAKQILNILDPQKPFITIALGKICDHSQASKEINDMEFQKRERKIDLAKKLI